MQVRHRCRCTKPDKCGEEEKAVRAAAAKGLFPSNYILNPDGTMVGR